MGEMEAGGGRGGEGGYSERRGVSVARCVDVTFKHMFRAGVAKCFVSRLSLVKEGDLSFCCDVSLVSRSFVPGPVIVSLYGVLFFVSSITGDHS